MKPVAGALLLLLLSGCSAAPGGQASAHDLVIGAPPAPGFSQRLDLAQGIDPASRATSADPTRARAALLKAGFLDGWARAWISGDEDVEILVFELADAAGARELAQFQVAELDRGVGVTPYPDTDIPGAVAFDLYGNTRAGSRQVFCQGVWFTAAQYAFEATDCASSPRYANLVLAMAREQYVTASQRLGLPVAPVSSSPSAAGR